MVISLFQLAKFRFGAVFTDFSVMINYSLYVKMFVVLSFVKVFVLESVQSSLLYCDLQS